MPIEGRYVDTYTYNCVMVLERDSRMKHSIWVSHCFIDVIPFYVYMINNIYQAMCYMNFQCSAAVHIVKVA